MKAEKWEDGVKSLVTQVMEKGCAGAGVGQGPDAVLTA